MKDPRLKKLVTAVRDEVTASQADPIPPTQRVGETRVRRLTRVLAQKHRVGARIAKPARAR